MRLLVRLLQPLGRDVRVNLRRHQMRMPKQFLHAAQIRARIQKMRRITVPQFVRRDGRIQPRQRQIFLQARARASRSSSACRFRSPIKTPATSRGGAGNMCPITLNRFQRRLADGHKSFLSSLAAHPDDLLAQSTSSTRKPHISLIAQTAGINRFQNCHIPMTRPPWTPVGPALFRFGASRTFKRRHQANPPSAEP